MDIWGVLTICSLVMSVAAFAWSSVSYRRICRACDRIDSARASIAKSEIRIEAAEAALTRAWS